MSRIVVIGGSTGAVKALASILPMLPHDFPAAILIVTHIASQKSILPEILGRCATMPVRRAVDGEPIMPGRILVAVPDEHLTVVMKDGKAYVRLIHGPKENFCRPAIDPLFRSAASAFLENTIGVLLTGDLDDGTVGLQAVKACGGQAIVQDPMEAEALDMPASAIEHANVDQVLSVRDIGPALVALVGRRTRPDGPGARDSTVSVPEWVDIENRMVSRDSEMEDLEHLGQPSSLTCPECAGTLWEIGRGSPIRYRCHTGHAFTAKVLEALQRDAVEDAMWGAVRALHEQERLFTRLLDMERKAGHAERAAEYQAKAANARTHSQTLREVIAARALKIGDDNV
jgi:two-component system chemotaxis response regulator CheB